MPGIVGCLAENGTSKELLLARTSMIYSASNRNDSLFEDEKIRCTRTHLNTIGEKKSPTIRKHLLVWVEGEFYNINQVKTMYDLKSNTEGEILLEAFEERKLESLLKSIDGYFCAVIYDTKENKLTFITDRYGLKPLYIWVEGRKLVFSSELKCFLAFSSFIPIVEQSSIVQFLNFGHLYGNNTWFKNVELLGASTLMVYSIIKKKVTKKVTYWSWSEIKKIDISFTEASVHVANLLKSAVSKRTLTKPKTKYSVSLSGGLDSRAILACTPKEAILESFTFGIKRCDDVSIARKIAKLKTIPHHFFELNKKNWFNKRIEGIWRNDGAIDFMHLHATQYHEEMAELAPISLNGFAGDLVLGGSYLEKCDQRISKASILDKITITPNLNIDTPFFDIKKEDPFYIDFKVRRFTANGLNEIKFFENRVPFFDNDLIEFIYSLPDSYRWGNKIYADLLLRSWPAFFKKIPRTGALYPISNEKTYLSLLFYLFNRVLKKTGIKFSNFARYERWINSKELDFSFLLTNSSCIIASILENKEIISAGRNFINRTEIITRLVSMEIWFQQALNQNLLTTEQFSEFINE